VATPIYSDLLQIRLVQFGKMLLSLLVFAIGFKSKVLLRKLDDVADGVVTPKNAGNRLFGMPKTVAAAPTRDLKRCPPREHPWEPLIDNLLIWQGAVKGTPRIMCMVYTVKGEHKKPRAPLQQAQFKTWATRCDKFLFFTDEDLGALPHQVVTPLVGKEEYTNMWQKVRAIWKYAYEHLVADYDYFTINGDDLYMNVENLRRLLLRPDIAEKHARNEPLYLGRRFMMDDNKTEFNTGGYKQMIHSRLVYTSTVL
jgi:hypothetical protein